jgi:hypothetical protein
MSEINPHSDRLSSIYEQIKSLKDYIQNYQITESSDSDLRFIEGFKWSIGKLDKKQDLKSFNDKVDRLNNLLNVCQNSNSQVQELQRAVMEIPSLAPPGHKPSINALATLLNYENKHIWINAFYSLGQIGGGEARKIIESYSNSNLSDKKRVAVETLCFLICSDIVEKLRDYVLELEEDNKRLNIILSPKVSAQTVFVCSGGAILSFVLALIAWFRYDLVLIHPAIAMVGLLFSVGLAAASIWRFKCQ